MYNIKVYMWYQDSPEKRVGICFGITRDKFMSDLISDIKCK